MAALEDTLVLQLISKYGLKWSRIASFLPGRIGKQVRDRYLNSLKPDIKHNNWTPEEDDLFIRLYHKYGNKWCEIASHIPGRTESQAKNRFYTHIKERIDEPYRKATSFADNNSPNIENLEVVQNTMQTSHSECEDESHKCALVEKNLKSYCQLQQEIPEKEFSLFLDEEQIHFQTASPNKRVRTLPNQSKIIDPAYLIAFDEIIDFSEVMDANNDYFKFSGCFYEEQNPFELK